MPQNIYSQWNTYLLKDEDLAQQICLHLQGIGKFVKAMDIVHYLDTPERKASLKLKKKYLTCNSPIMDACDGLLMDKRSERSVCRWT